MTTRRDNPDGPEDINAAFAEIIADLEKDETFAQRVSDAEARQRADEGKAPDTAPEDGPAVEAGAGEDEEHFVPPEPPPLPRPQPATLLGVAVILLGLLVLVFPQLAGPAAGMTLPLGLLLISGGLGWLLFRLRQGPDEPDDDDGARV